MNVIVKRIIFKVGELFVFKDLCLENAIRIEIMISNQLYL